MSWSQKIHYTFSYILIIAVPSPSLFSQQEGEFVWDKETQGLVLGSFFWGYLVTQIPGGWLAARFGGKRIFGWCMLATALATLLAPIGARTHHIFLMVLRFIAGLGEVCDCFIWRGGGVNGAFKHLR